MVRIARKIPIDPIARLFIRRLKDKGFEAYLVGGCVRDALFGIHTTDIDIATSAIPSKVKSIFPKFNILDYGEKHGTVSILHESNTIEITTFRTESGYSDGRRPDEVNFVSSLEEDLSRRDFTINALAAKEDGTIIDLHQGLDDLDKNIIRAVGDPIHRFQEDSLRVLRAARFALRFGFKIENKTKTAIQENAELLRTHQISGERILIELREIFRFTPDCISMLAKLRLLRVLFPEISDHDNEEVLIRSSKRIRPDNEMLVWSLVLFYSQDPNGLKVQTDRFDMMLKRFPGLGNQQESYIKNLSKNIPYLTLLQTTSDKSEIVFFVRHTTKWVKKLPDFVLSDYLHDLVTLGSIVYTTVSQNLLETILKTINQPMGKVSINGNYVKGLGLKKREIGAFMEELSLLEDLGFDVSLPNLSKYYDKLCKQEILDLDKLRATLALGSPSGSALEDMALMDSLRRRVIVNKCDILVILYYEEDLGLITQINEIQTYPKYLGIQALETEIGKKGVRQGQFLVQKDKTDMDQQVNDLTSKLKNRSSP